MAEGLRTATSLVFDGSGVNAPRTRGAANGDKSKWYGGDVNLSYDTSIPDPMMYKKWLDDSGKFFNEKQRQYLAGRIHDKSLEQRDAARSREQQEGNYAYQNWNLAQDNPRGNLNQMSYGDTLRYSRLADMVNNKFHYRPGHQQLIGTGKKGIMQQADTATISRWDPIETEEMRQMQANREMDKRARQAGVDLQARIEAYPQEVQEAMDEMDRDFQKFLSESDVKFIQESLIKRLEVEYGGSWRNFFQMCLETFNKELELSIGQRILDAVKHLTPNWMQVALQVFLRGATVPSYLQTLDEQTMAQTIETLMEKGYSLEEAIQHAFTISQVRGHTMNEVAGVEYKNTDSKKQSSRQSSGGTNTRSVNRDNSRQRRNSGKYR